MIPNGKGLFVRFLRDDQVDHLIARCQRAGIDWVAILVLWQYAKKRSRVGRDPSVQTHRLIDAGLRPLPWAYSVPGRTDELVRVLSVNAAKMGARECIIDAEVEWKRAKAMPLVAAVNALKVGGRSVGLTSYGAPWNHKTFPWEAARAADFVLPQIYEMSPMPAGYPARSVAAWRELGGRSIVPATSGMTSTRHMRSLLARTPAPQGVVWWDLLNLDASPKRWDVVRDYRTGGAP